VLASGYGAAEEPRKSLRGQEVCFSSPDAWCAWKASWMAQQLGRQDFGRRAARCPEAWVACRGRGWMQESNRCEGNEGLPVRPAHTSRRMFPMTKQHILARQFGRKTGQWFYGVNAGVARPFMRGRPGVRFSRGVQPLTAPKSSDKGQQQWRIPPIKGSIRAAE
jgi:hypothetical protein